MKKFRITIGACVIGVISFSSSGIRADNSAAAATLSDRLFVDFGSTLHVPQTTASWFGGLGGVGYMFRDLNIGISAKYLTTALAQTQAVSGLVFGARVEGKYALVPNLITLLPGVFGGLGDFKEQTSGNKYSGYWVEIGIGAQIPITNEISFLSRPYYAFSRVTSGGNAADISALGIDITIRYAFGQTHRLEY